MQLERASWLRLNPTIYLRYKIYNSVELVTVKRQLNLINLVALDNRPAEAAAG
jgi:hypothetical protein